MPPIPIASQTYNVAGSPYRLGPVPLTQGQYCEVDLTPDSALLAGSTLAYSIEHSTDGGSTWHRDGGSGPTNIVGPVSAADLFTSVSLEVKAANWQARASLTVVAGSWTTGFLANLTVAPLPVTVSG